MIANGIRDTTLLVLNTGIEMIKKLSLVLFVLSASIAYAGNCADVHFYYSSSCNYSGYVHQTSSDRKIYCAKITDAYGVVSYRLFKLKCDGSTMRILTTGNMTMEYLNSDTSSNYPEISNGGCSSDPAVKEVRLSNSTSEQVTKDVCDTYKQLRQ
jgi:hypothetical protein